MRRWRVPSDADISLLASLRSGTAGAWEAVIDRYGALVYSIPLNFGLNHADAADVAQTTFTELCAQVDRIRDEARLGSWLMTVARRQTWRRVEALRQQMPIEQVPELPSDDDAERRIVDLAWLDAGLAQLDPKCRALIELMFLSGSEPSYTEISEQLAIPVGSIGPTRQRCLDRLRSALDDEAT